jgi:hypothetical protein
MGWHASSSTADITAAHNVQKRHEMTDRPLKVDRKKFEGIVKNLLDTPPVKRDDVKVSKKKPEKLIPPQKLAL